MRFVPGIAFVLLASIGSYAQDQVLETPQPFTPADEAPTPSSLDYTIGSADVAGVRLSLGLGVLSGESQFEIGGKSESYDGRVTQYWFPISRLEFPTDVSIIKLGGTYATNDKVGFRGSLGGNLSSDAGTTKDSGWVLGPNSLDIYSESDTELDGTLLDLGASYLVYASPKWRINAGLGYARQKLDFEISDVIQISRFRGMSGYAPGLVSTYDVEYTALYVDLSIATKFQFFNSPLWMEGRLGYTPVASAEDNGNWLLRDKTFNGDADGDAVLFSISARYDLGKNWFGTVGLERNVFQLEGHQDQYFGNSFFGRIENEIDLDQTQFVIAIGTKL